MEQPKLPETNPAGVEATVAWIKARGPQTPPPFEERLKRTLQEWDETLRKLAEND